MVSLGPWEGILLSIILVPLIILFLVRHIYKKKIRTRLKLLEENPQKHGSVTVENKGFTILISYRRDDTAQVTGRLYDQLIQRYGKEAIFKDVDSIPLGVDFRTELDKAVGQCNILLAVIGKNWTSRLDNPQDFVRIEIESALNRNISIIPILVDGASMPEEKTLPLSLGNLVYYNGIEIRPDPDFHNDVDRLIRALDHHTQAK